MRALKLFSLLFVTVVLYSGQLREKKVDIPKGGGIVSTEGYVGGESHDEYSVALEIGQNLTVSISAKGGRAEFVVSDSSDFHNASPASFGKEEPKRHRWSGIVPATKRYYVYVTAYPETHYVLRLSVK